MATGHAREARSRSLLERLARLPADARERCLSVVPAGERYGLLTSWGFRARPEQLAPAGDWTVWLILAGRGFGKTRAGAEWVTRMAMTHPGCRIALVGATQVDVAQVMVGGESGLMAVAPDGQRPKVTKGARQLTWPNGSTAMMVSAFEANRLRGPQFHFAWCDEIAAWTRPKAAWDNLRMGLRLGDRPRVVVTTTPRPTPFVIELLKADGVAVTRGRTRDNRLNLPASYVREMQAAYGGTALGRQELEGEVLERVEGALWSHDLLDRCRQPAPPGLKRIVVGVDPPATVGTCGIVVAGVDDGNHAHVLADASVSATSPRGWADAVIGAADRFGADCVVVEVNQGGNMALSVLEASGRRLPLKSVRAAIGKSARAEPVATLYARGLVHHQEPFRELEDQLCGLMMGGGYAGPGSSPDRADALVWAVSELLLGQPMVTPGLRIV
jgi:phage terminase large subunit-like protein